MKFILSYIFPGDCSSASGCVCYCMTELLDSLRAHEPDLLQMIAEAEMRLQHTTSSSSSNAHIYRWEEIKQSSVNQSIYQSINHSNTQWLLLGNYGSFLCGKKRERKHFSSACLVYFSGTLCISWAVWCRCYPLMWACLLMPTRSCTGRTKYSSIICIQRISHLLYTRYNNHTDKKR